MQALGGTADASLLQQSVEGGEEVQIQLHESKSQPIKVAFAVMRHRVQDELVTTNPNHGAPHEPTDHHFR